jgi:hypothetical protein
MRYALLTPLFGMLLWTAGCSPKTAEPSVTATSEGQETQATSGKAAAYRDTALLRFFNADPGHPALDVMGAKDPLFNQVKYKSITPYIEAARGVTQFATSAGGAKNLATTRRELFPGRHYTVMALPGKKGAARLVSFSDDLGKIDPEQARVRLINATTDIDDLDLYIQGTDTRVLHGSGSGDVVSFAEMYAAMVEIRPSKKSVPKAFSNLMVEPGRLYTFVAVDDGGTLDVVQIVDRLEP